MNTSTPAKLVSQMSRGAKARFASDAGWAQAAGLPRETLSRLKKQPSCDLRTLGALAASAGYRLLAVPDTALGDELVPARFDRGHEDRLLDLCASGELDPGVWRAHGPAFFMAGLAVMLASARGFERERYLRLAEALHAGSSTPEVFGLWLSRSPVRAARFLPMARRRKRIA